MRVFYRGFNLYGQFPKCSHVVDSFIDQFSCYENADEVRFSHSFCIVRRGDELTYYGQVDEIYDSSSRCNTKKIKFSSVKNLVKIHCTDDIIIILTKSGDVFKIIIGNLDGIIESPRLWELGESITKTACGKKIHIAYSDKGKLYNLNDLISFQFQNKNIIDIQCGREHCLLLDGEGNVYSFGRGSRGQLGHGNLEDRKEPEVIRVLEGLKMVTIAAGGWHSCVVSEAGDLYTWGWNGNGQLGLGSDKLSVMATPTLIDFNKEINVSKVACGTRHTIALLENNKLFGCGWNKYKQLTADETENIYNMTYLYDFSGYDVMELQCAMWSSVVLCKEQIVSDLVITK